MIILSHLVQHKMGVVERDGVVEGKGVFNTLSILLGLPQKTWNKSAGGVLTL